MSGIAKLSQKAVIILPLLALLTILGLKALRPTSSVIDVPGSSPNPQAIATFEECAAAGYPIMESYPERCSTPDGRTFTRVTTDESPTPITASGVFDCLPKIPTNGAITLECAFGLKTDVGFYALDTSAIESRNYPSFQSGQKITVEGLLVPQESISSDRYQTYDIIGVISVERITKN